MFPAVTYANATVTFPGAAYMNDTRNTVNTRKALLGYQESARLGAPRALLLRR